SFTRCAPFCETRDISSLISVSLLLDSCGSDEFTPNCSVDTPSEPSGRFDATTTRPDGTCRYGSAFRESTDRYARSSLIIEPQCDVRVSMPPPPDDLAFPPLWGTEKGDM